MLLGFLCCMTGRANSVRVYGYVVDETNQSIEFANVWIEGTTVGCTTSKNGYYDLKVDIAECDGRLLDGGLPNGEAYD